MRGMILYSLTDADKNSWFIRRLQEEAARPSAQPVHY